MHVFYEKKTEKNENLIHIFSEKQQRIIFRPILAALASSLGKQELSTQINR